MIYVIIAIIVIAVLAIIANNQYGSDGISTPTAKVVTPNCPVKCDKPCAGAQGKFEDSKGLNQALKDIGIVEKTISPVSKTIKAPAKKKVTKKTK